MKLNAPKFSASLHLKKLSAKINSYKSLPMMDMKKNTPIIAEKLPPMYEKTSSNFRYCLVITTVLEDL